MYASPVAFVATTSGAGSGDGCAEPDRRVWAGMRCPSEQLCAVSAADRGADVQFAPEGFAPRWSLPSPFHGEEAKLPKGCGAFRTADQTISSLCGAYALPAESIHIAKKK